jgi:hypothetical protein
VRLAAAFLMTRGGVRLERRASRDVIADPSSSPGSALPPRLASSSARDANPSRFSDG